MYQELKNYKKSYSINLIPVQANVSIITFNLTLLM